MVWVLEMSKRISLIVAEELWEKLSILAIKKKTSKNQLIIEMIEQALKKGSLRD